jgi:2'-5' RNA ligase
VWLGIAALVPDDVHNFMRSIAVELCVRWGGQASSTVLEPHVTIKQPYEGDVEVASEYLDELAARVEPFELALGGYAEFEHEGVVFLDVVEGAQRILELQRQVLDELALEPAAFESGEPAPYHVHATLAVGLAPAQRQAALASLPTPPGFRFTVERLGLFARVEAGWLVYRRAGLG